MKEPEAPEEVPGWPGYLATRTGEVLSKTTRQPLKWWQHYRTKHRRVRLYGSAGHLRGTKGGSYANLYVHQVVCLTFHGPPPFEGALVRHLDNDASNNAAENLAWGTAKDNADDYWSDEDCLFNREERRALREREQLEYEADFELGF